MSHTLGCILEKQIRPKGWMKTCHGVAPRVFNLGLNSPMQLERVGTVSVSGLFLKVAWQVDDGQGPEWTFLMRVE